MGGPKDWAGTIPPVLSTSSTNRLADASSPYLRLHAHNPVDWYPWGEEALARARAEDKPIFLSVGYSTCHWCHVMERESFSDPAIAELMNRDFVNIKVDREERPDLDEAYMMATQLLGGQGGWPNSVFLTPALEPFFAGTYFPPEDRWGRPGFPTVLRSLADAWANRRGDVEAQAREAAATLKLALAERPAGAPEPPGAEVARAALGALGRAFDGTWGGFGSAPKFPTPSNLFLLAELSPENERAEDMLATTLDRMARGGICDQLAGGFHRYSVDREWRVPHFEKMLYDNGLLLAVYAGRFGRTGDPEAARVARATAGFLTAELGAPEGGFWSAIDADSEGEEGAYYVWRRDELLEVLREEDFGFLAPLLGFDVAPFFEGDRYVLHLPAPLADQAVRRRTTRDALLEEMAPPMRRLLAARSLRPRPATDDKVLADWNGMAIAGLAEAGRRLAEPPLVERAAAAAEFVLAALRPTGGSLRHSWREGRVGSEAFLGDYVWMVRGLLALFEATGGERWLSAALELTMEQERRLGDVDGTYWGAAESADLLARGKELFDGAVPAANGIAALNAVELASATGDASWTARAARLLAACGGALARQPSGTATLALAAFRLAAAAPSFPARSVSPPVGSAPAGRRAAAEAWHADTAERKVGERDRVGEGLPVAEAEAGKVGLRPYAALEDEARRAVTAEVRVGGTDRAGDGLAAAEEEAHGWRPFTVELRLAAGWHLAGPGDESGGVSLAGRGVELTDVVIPLDPGASALRGRLRAIGEAPALLLSFQACDENRCLPRAVLELPVEP